MTVRHRTKKYCLTAFHNNMLNFNWPFFRTDPVTLWESVPLVRLNMGDMFFNDGYIRLYKRKIR